jgi:hypothetical protein
VLGLIGGILILLGGLDELVVLYTTVVSVAPFVGGFWLAALGLIGVGAGLVVILFSVFVYVNPRQHVVYGVIILIGSLLSVFALSGFLVGLVLGVVGGALAIAWSPYRSAFAPYVFAPYAGGPYGTMPPSAGPIAHRACLKCGRLVAADARFCSYCGAPIGGG